MNNLLILGQAGGSGMNISVILMYASIFAVIYFFMIRPQTKRAKEQQNFLNNLQKGEQVVTSGGVHGKIVNLHGDLISLEVAHNIRIKVTRSAISHEMSKALSEATVVNNPT